MNQDTLRRFQQPHNFVRYSKKNERQVWIVLVITAMAIVAEIVAGTWYGSMALLAEALTSLAAIAALLAGKWFGWNWMDPMMGWLAALSSLSGLRSCLKKPPSFYWITVFLLKSLIKL